LAAVYANPADLAARMVYADSLSEAGDPRGEFIVLQCRHNGPMGDRERELLAAHGDGWVGPLAPLLAKNPRIFERGFLSACSVRPDCDDPLLATVGDPAWSTVRMLHFFGVFAGEARRRASAAVLLHPVMRSLEAAIGIHGSVLVELCEHATPLPIRSITATVGTFLERTRARDAFADPRGLPALRKLWFIGSGGKVNDLGWLLASPLIGRLEQLTLSMTGGDIDRWKRIASQAHPHLPLLEIRNGDDIIRFRRGPDGRFGDPSFERA
jgi:uncharacterized protein (TIGR02996 family)